MHRIDGIDVLVFTGRVDENSPEIRENICSRLLWLGLHLDDAANTTAREAVSAPESKFDAFTLPTDEKLDIGQHVLEIMKQQKG